jgi:hypothetical protein
MLQTQQPLHIGYAHHILVTFLVTLLYAILRHPATLSRMAYKTIARQMIVQNTIYAWI